MFVLVIDRHSCISKLKLFFKWGIEFDTEKYTVPDKGARKISYTNKEIIENNMLEQYPDSYIKETNHHVAYRVTPIFEGNNLVCSGVQIEAYFVEDNGEGICFNVYCYNVQPGITIDYATGNSSGPQSSTTSKPETTKPAESVTQPPAEQPGNTDMVWIPKSGSKYHSRSSCSNMKNPTQVSRSEAIRRGYEPCKKCY